MLKLYRQRSKKKTPELRLETCPVPVQDQLYSLGQACLSPDLSFPSCEMKGLD